MTKSRENTLTCLLLDVKEAFDHVTLKQLVKILIKLKILINLINWVKCFLQNWVIDLAFDDERQKSKKIITEILQDSSISLILFLIYIEYLFSKIRAKIENLQSFSYIDDLALYMKRFFIYFFIKFMQFFFIFFYFFIKCMQSMTMTLSRRCMYAKLYVTWSKSLLYIFSLINHIDSLRIQALSLKLSSSYFRFSLFLRTLRVLLFRF